MLSLFKRYRLNRSAVHTISPFTFLTVCERVKPMTQVEFEFAQQSLELSSEWLYKQQADLSYSDAGHFVVQEYEDSGYQELLSRKFALCSVPVALVNCHELLLKAIPVLALDNEGIGVIHIGHGFELKQSLEPTLGSAFHFMLSRFQNTRAFFIGAEVKRTPAQILEYAEDLGCDWLSSDECSFRHRSLLKNQLNHFMEHCDQLVLNIDLASLVPSSGLSDDGILDNQMVLRILRHAILSKKVKLVQLVGSKDKLIYSKQTKEIVDELCSLSPEIIHTA
ncbi:arginase [Vibrio ziniensis]|uniref:Arginase n=1 Tax=Vibrio ziniensis TaxID=2711221 RepID=A0A6G7CNV5_9VIBR|nr:arginase [Vibrio ziniensis]QIH43708.1 arginase [Vibrio ziniensis]